MLRVWQQFKENKLIKVHREVEVRCLFFYSLVTSIQSKLICCKDMLCCPYVINFIPK